MTECPMSLIKSARGARGSDGLNGSDGMTGSSGSMGSTDPNNPSAGGNGGNGTDGSNGGDGGNGGNAPPVQVRITLRPGPHPLFQASVSAAGKQRLYLIDPQGGALTVKADGGLAAQAGEAVVAARAALVVSERPAAAADLRAPMDQTASKARRAAAAASPSPTTRRSNLTSQPSAYPTAAVQRRYSMRTRGSPLVNQA
jgi:hypothetical protein